MLTFNDKEDTSKGLQAWIKRHSIHRFPFSSHDFSSNLYYSLQRDNHASKRIHFFLSNRNTIFIVRSSNFIFTLKLTIRLKILNHPNDSHENFLCDVGEEQSHQRSRGEEGKQR